MHWIRQMTTMKVKIPFLFISALFILLQSCGDGEKQVNPNDETILDANRKQIAALLDSLNQAAADADYDLYFSFYSDDAVFIGTDATERWDKQSFMTWAKPFFDRKTTWNFHCMKRNIEFGSYMDIAWFDELLNTQMKICRGSGVVIKTDRGWQIQQYVLSVTAPNSSIDSIVSIKALTEDSLIEVLSRQIKR